MILLDENFSTILIIHQFLITSSRYQNEIPLYVILNSDRPFFQFRVFPIEQTTSQRRERNPRLRLRVHTSMLSWRVYSVTIM